MHTHVFFMTNANNFLFLTVKHTTFCRIWTVSLFDCEILLFLKTMSSYCNHENASKNEYRYTCTHSRFHIYKTHCQVHMIKDTSY